MVMKIAAKHSVGREYFIVVLPISEKKQPRTLDRAGGDDYPFRANYQPPTVGRFGFNALKSAIRFEAESRRCSVKPHLKSIVLAQISIKERGYIAMLERRPLGETGEMRWRTAIFSPTKIGIIVAAGGQRKQSLDLGQIGHEFRVIDWPCAISQVSRKHGNHSATPPGGGAAQAPEAAVCSATVNRTEVGDQVEWMGLAVLLRATRFDDNHAPAGASDSCGCDESGNAGAHDEDIGFTGLRDERRARKHTNHPSALSASEA
jgi:hypothetical protein